MYTIDAKRQRLIIGVLALLFYAVTPSIANENLLQLLEKEFQKVVTDTRPALVKVVATQIPNAEKSEFTRQNIGSGIVIDADGHIVTTTFEMEKPNKIEVIFKDEKVSAAQLAGIDTFTDIAVLRVTDVHLATAHLQNSKTVARVKWGDSSKINTGSWVVTMGSAYGHSPIVSFGIVGGWETLPDQLCGKLIKINAAVTPGNNGGAVVNTSGEIVGMILAVLTEPPYTINTSPGPLFQKERDPGISQFFVQELSPEITFALPIEMVHSVAKEIIEHGKVARGWLGVEVDVGESGVFVKGVLEGSPAHKSGILPRDIILKFNETSVRSYDELLRCVASERPATKVKLKIGRNGTEQHRTVILGERQ